MWQSPCTNCRRTDQGRLFFVYVKTYEGRVLIQRRLRLCAEDMDMMENTVLRAAECRNAEGQWLSLEERADMSPAEVAESHVAPSTLAKRSAQISDFRQKAASRFS